MIQFSIRKPRRRTANISVSGTTMIHLRNPYVIAWWSAAFPGFGHLLMSKYSRGFLLVIWEMIINSQSNINLAMVYSFTGRFDMAKDIIDLRWMALYAPVYIFAIYDSYRTTIDLNKICILSERENAPFTSFKISPLGINYLDKRTPWVAIVWSILMPGMGQLYVHRITIAFYVLAVWILLCYQSHVLEAIHFTLVGDFTNVLTIVEPEWLLFLPSVFFFAIYEAYVSTVENNKLFEKEQVRFLKKNYQNKMAKRMLILHEGVMNNMNLVASFDHSVYLELALTALVEKGIPKGQILAIPLNNRTLERKIFDTIHKSDGISLFDTGAAFAVMLSVVGASYGFIAAWGPIIWGLIGAVTGFSIGFVWDLLYSKKQNQREIKKGKNTEVVIVIQCNKDQVEMMEQILWDHFALGVAKMDS
jgi:hypothetical protein